ncbi:hypothetical protein BC629DRAFT_1439610 [Irpex lacteus]|nr:hypothetical protein BC629DRAFT_1444512 [Irpex lacteus]KAI0795352.1 hypothetical protein BC629DRAFT_1439610 [Irpex lacteus]
MPYLRHCDPPQNPILEPVLATPSRTSRDRLRTAIRTSGGPKGSVEELRRVIAFFVEPWHAVHDFAYCYRRGGGPVESKRQKRRQSADRWWWWKTYKLRGDARYEPWVALRRVEPGKIRRDKPLLDNIPLAALERNRLAQQRRDFLCSVDVEYDDEMRLHDEWELYSGQGEGFGACSRQGVAKLIHIRQHHFHQEHTLVSSLRSLILMTNSLYPASFSSYRPSLPSPGLPTVSACLSDTADDDEPEPTTATVTPLTMMSDDQLRRVEENLLRYAHEMHEYTLQLWTDSRKAAEEKKAIRGAGERGKLDATKRRRAPDLIQAKARVVDFTQAVKNGDKESLAKASLKSPIESD